MPTLESVLLPIPVYEAQVLVTICDDGVAQARTNPAKLPARRDRQ
jgi:hypothetical protein